MILCYMKEDRIFFIIIRFFSSLGIELSLEKHTVRSDIKKFPDPIFSIISGQETETCDYCFPGHDSEKRRLFGLANCRSRRIFGPDRNRTLKKF